VLFDQYANWSVQVSDVYQGRGVITEVHRESIESKRLRIHNVLTSVRICDLADHVMRKPMKISFYKLKTHLHWLFGSCTLLDGSG
jgi:hypothetical protein